MRRRPPFTFPALGIPIGSRLQFTGSPITVTVTHDRMVRGACTHGDDMFLTPLTRHLLPHVGSVDPTHFWTYRGTLLIVRYFDAYDASRNLLDPGRLTES